MFPPETYQSSVLFVPKDNHSRWAEKPSANSVTVSLYSSHLSIFKGVVCLNESNDFMLMQVDRLVT